MSRFIRFLRVFVVAIACAFGMFAGAFSAQTGVTLDDQGAISAGAPHNIGSLSPNTQLLTDFPYKPGYGFAGYYDQTNCGGNRILTHEGKWSGTQYNGTIYACWVQLVYVMSNGQPSPYYKLFVLDGNGGSTGNMWPSHTPIWFDTNDLSYGGNGRAIRFENRGDWVYLWCQTFRNNECVSVLWMTPRNAAGGYYGSTTELFTNSDAFTKDLPGRTGYAFGGVYSTSGATGGTQYCNVDGNTVNMAFHSNNFDNLSAFSTIYARWNAMTVSLGGGYATPATVYFNGTSWYSDINATSPISGVTISSNGNYVFGGYWTGENGTGVKVVDESGTLLAGTDVVNVIRDGITLHPYWRSDPTWATLTINDQGAQTGTSPAPLFYPLTGCSISGYHSLALCENNNVVSYLYVVPARAGWTYRGHYTGRGGTGTEFITYGNGHWNLPEYGITNYTQIYAKWTFNVVFTAGTGAGGEQTNGPSSGCPSGTQYCCVDQGTGCVAPSNTFTPPSGKVFDGWTCTLTGAGNVGGSSCAGPTSTTNIYYPGDSLIGATEGVTGATGIRLTARWANTPTPVTYHTIKLINGGINRPTAIYEREGIGFFACSTSDCDDATQITASIFEPVSNGGAGLTRPTSSTGGTFKGYFLSSSGAGDLIIDNNGNIRVGSSYFDDDELLYAVFDSNAQEVRFEANGGTFGNCTVTSITAFPGQSLPSPLSCGPTRSGHRFLGYYNPDNTNEQYYTNDLYAVRSWPVSNAPTGLIARWEPINYVVNYYCDGTLVHTDGVHYGQVYTMWNGAANACNNAGATSGNNGAGSKLVGWTSGSYSYGVSEQVSSWPFSGNVNFNWERRPIYLVNLNHGSNLNNTPAPNVVYYSKDLNNNAHWFGDATAYNEITQMNTVPVRYGYDLQGYYIGTTQVVSATGAFMGTVSANDKTANVNWAVHRYHVTFDKNGGTGGTSDLYFRADVDGGAWVASENSTTPVTSITKPTKVVGNTTYIFGGYWTKAEGPNGNGTMIVEANGTLVSGQQVTQMFGTSQIGSELFAYWTEQPTPPSDPNDYFAVTTTTLGANTEFQFVMRAAGDFYVQWDTTDPSTIEHIVRNDTNVQVYSHTYANAAPSGKTIKIWRTPGTVPTYFGEPNNTIYFGAMSMIINGTPTLVGTPSLVGGISGSLGGVFPTVGDSGDLSTIPCFGSVFSGCSNLIGTIPANLFGYESGGHYIGVTGARPYMFMSAFSDTGLSGAIPETLFGRKIGGVYHGVSGAAQQMFSNTFRDTNITSIPAGLFEGITGVAPYMFNETFVFASSLTTIPDGLFSGISATGNVTGFAEHMFDSTFVGTGITSLPATLFGTINASGVSRENMMYHMFAVTPLNASGQNYIPKTLFLDSNNQLRITDNTNGTLMTGIFAETGLVTNCDDVNLTHYPTDYDDSYWNGKKICAPAAVFSCENPSLGGTPTGTLDTIWMDQITVSTTLPAATNCTAPTHYTKPSTAYWACTGNSNCTGNHWAAGEAKPSWLTSSLTQSVNFYMEYTPDQYTITLYQNHDANDNTTLGTIVEKYGVEWLNNGLHIDSVAGLIPSSWNDGTNTYNFDGYFTARSGGTRMTNPDGTFTNDAATFMLGSAMPWYAQWATSDGPFTVTYSCGDHGTWTNAQTSNEQTVNYGVSMTLKGSGVCTAATGYTFDKWKIMANGVEKSAGASYTWPLHSGSNIVAQWKGVPRTISLLNAPSGISGVGCGEQTCASALYATYDIGVFRDSNRTEQMTPTLNPLTPLPTRNQPITLWGNGGTFPDPEHPGQTVNTLPGSVLWDLRGYYTTIASGVTEQDKTIEPNGYITLHGIEVGSGLTSGTNWYARWYNPVGSLVRPDRQGYVFNGYYTYNSGTGVCNTSQTTNSSLEIPSSSLSAASNNDNWCAKWTQCAATLPSPTTTNSSITGYYTNDLNQCQYEITCDACWDNTSGCYVRGGETVFLITPLSSTGTTITSGTLSGQNLDAAICSPNVYGIYYDYGAEPVVAGCTQVEYTYGTQTTINCTPSSNTAEFVSWCTDLTDPTTCSAHPTISATDYGVKIYYAKWNDTCSPGYTRYSYTTYATEFGASENTTYPAGVCAPIRYRVNCDKNCPDGEECYACLEDFEFPFGTGSVVAKFGGVYNAWQLSPVGSNNPATAYTPIESTGNVTPDPLWLFTQGTNTNYEIRPLSFSEDSLWIAFSLNNYNTFMQTLAGYNVGKSFGTAHYDFDGLYTVSDLPYINANGNVAWFYNPNSNNSANLSAAQAFSTFFQFAGGGGANTTNDYAVNVHAQWKPHRYDVTLYQNRTANDNTTVGSTVWEKYGTGWGNSNDENGLFTSYEDFTLTLPNMRTGYTFSGYYNDRDNGQMMADSSGMPLSNKVATASDTKWYAHWNANTYTISYQNISYQNGGDNGVNNPTSAVYGAIVNINNPSPTGNQAAFAGWMITGLQEWNYALYGESASSLDGYTIDDHLDLTGQTNIKYFKNLRSDPGVVTFTAKWVCNPGYTGDDCSSVAKYTVTIKAMGARGMATVSGTGWNGTGTAQMSKECDFGETITMVQPTDNPGNNVTATPKQAYGGATYSKQDGGMPGEMTHQNYTTYTFTVGAGDAVIEVKPKALSGPSPTLSGGGSQIYNYQYIPLEGSYSTEYPTDTGIVLTYELRRSDNIVFGQSYDVVKSGTLPLGTDLIEYIDKDEFRGTKYYKFYLNANDGHVGAGSDSSPVSVTLENKAITFNPNGGALSGTSTSPLYVSYDDYHLYTTATGNTGASTPVATLEHNRFTGWYTAADNSGQQIYNGDGILTTNSVSGYVSGGKWVTVSPRTLYAHWTPELYPVTLNPNGGLGGVSTIYERYGVGWQINPNASFITTLEGTDLPQWTGYTFAGYYTDPNNGSPVGTYSDGTWTLPPYNTVGTTGVTWYAHWTPLQYTVTYDCGAANGGTHTYNVNYDETHTVKTRAQVGCDETLVGRYFNGWHVTPGHGNSDIKYEGDSFGWDYTANQTFTARWIDKWYHVTFDPNGGSGGTDDVWMYYDNVWRNELDGTEIATIELPYNNGQTFAGYTLQQNGGTPLITSETLPPATLNFGDTATTSPVEVTLYAQWSNDTFPINYDASPAERAFPTGYTFLEYINFNGNQYIDTGKKIKRDYEIQAKFMPFALGEKYFYAVKGAGQTSDNVTAYFGGRWIWGSQSVTGNMQAPINIIHTLIQNADGITTDGQLVQSYESQDDFETSFTLVIGTPHTTSGGYNVSGYMFQGNIYGFKIYDENGSVIYSGVPAKHNSDNKYGLYDVVSGTFTELSGTDIENLSHGAALATPGSYTHGTAATISGIALRSNHVFESWCTNINDATTCALPQEISASAYGLKNFIAKWSCVPGYHLQNNSCVANNITIDWDENNNGGTEISNWQCTYNGNLNLANAPVYSGYEFNGWKLFDDSVSAANASIVGGCVYDKIGVYNGTSTAIQAQWCPACNPTDGASCTRTNTTPGSQCTYTTSCPDGYDISGNGTATPSCAPHVYTITYDVNGGTGTIANQSVEYLDEFDTNNATGISKTNSIVKNWNVISGGNYTVVGGHYEHYDVTVNTSLQANWVECVCNHGDDVANCETSASNNQCAATVTCASGYDPNSAVASCVGEICSASCGAGLYEIILDQNGATTGGTAKVYTKYNDAVYIDARRRSQDKMTSANNPITIPQISYTIRYEANGGTYIGGNTIPDSTADAVFNGYFDSTDDDATQYINGSEDAAPAPGYITTEGDADGKSYTSSSVWYAKWTKASVTLPIVYRPGYVFAGWWTTQDESGFNRGNGTYTPQQGETLYAHWTECLAGYYCPGSETVDGSIVYNTVNACPVLYPNSAVASVSINDCYLDLETGSYVPTMSGGAQQCQANNYCDVTGNVYYAGDGHTTTVAQKSCATNAGAFQYSAAGSDEINDCYKFVTLNKRGGNGYVVNWNGNAISGFESAENKCFYQRNCNFPDAAGLSMDGYHYYHGWNVQNADCDNDDNPYVAVVADDVNTYYACRMPNTYTVTLKNGLNTSVTYETVTPVFNSPMPTPLTVIPTMTGNNTTYVFAGYYDTELTGGDKYYNSDRSSAKNWDKTQNASLYARWGIKCAPGYYLKKKTSVCRICPAGKYCDGAETYSYSETSDQGLTGIVAAGYYSTGGAVRADPQGYGNGCVGQIEVTGNAVNTTCGLIAGGYYSAGGGISAQPANNTGCLSEDCGVLGALYYSSGGGKTATPSGTNNAGCISGQTCGMCPYNYQDSDTTGKNAITACVASCDAGKRVVTAANSNANIPNAVGCTTPIGNNWYSLEHDVAYGGVSISDVDVFACTTDYNTPNTGNTSDHDAVDDCKRTVQLDKNGGTGVVNNVGGDTSPVNIVCSENQSCDFGDTSSGTNALTQSGYNFLGGWGTTTGCSSTQHTFTTPDNDYYYACKAPVSNYVLTYSCGSGSGVSGTPPSQETHYYGEENIEVKDSNTCAKVGHSFVRWAVSNTRPQEYQTVGATFTWNYTQNKTFVAEWEPVTYNIDYDFRGGADARSELYMPVEYIQGTGRMYFEPLMFVSKSSNFKTRIKVDMHDLYTGGAIGSYAAHTTISNRSDATFVYGAVGNSLNASGGTVGRLDYDSFGVVFEPAFRLADGTALDGGIVAQADHVYDIEQRANVLLVNGVLSSETIYTPNFDSASGSGLSSSGSGLLQPVRLISIYRASGAGTDDRIGRFKLYYFMLTNSSGVLQFNGIPVRQISTGKCGLYDTVNGRFDAGRSDSGTGAFACPDTPAYPATYTYGVGATVRGIPTRANSVFLGWCDSDGANCVTPKSVSGTDAGDKVFVASWACDAGYTASNDGLSCVRNSFTLTYTTDHGTAPTTPSSCSYGDEITLPAAPVEAGWNFQGWGRNGRTFDAGQTIICNEQNFGVTSGNVSIRARWNARCNKITLNPGNNGFTGSIAFLYKRTGETPWFTNDVCTAKYRGDSGVIPTREGYTFRGFYPGETLLADVEADMAAGAFAPGSSGWLQVFVMQYINTNGVPTSHGYSWTPSADATITAAWARDCSPVAPGSCDLDVAADGAVDYTTTCPTGFTINGNDTYHPSCSVNTFNVNLHKLGGSGACGGETGTTDGAITCIYGQACDLPAWDDCQIATSGQILTGWNTNSTGSGGTSYDIGGILPSRISNGEDIDLYAQWETASCTVVNGSATISISSNTPSCDVTCDTGYGVSGLYNGTQHNPVVNTNQCGLQPYDIRYELNGGVKAGDLSGYPESYTYGTAVTITGVPTREHSVFEGWCRNEDLSGTCTTPHNILATEHEDIDLYAKWSCVDGYNLNSTTGQCDANVITITYQKGNYGIGNPPLPDTCYYGGELTLPIAMVQTNPTMLFAGWAFTIDETTYTYPAETTITCDHDTLGVYGGNVVAVGQWEPQGYTVVFSCGVDEFGTSVGGSPTPVNKNAFTGVPFFGADPSSCNNPGYAFAGWLPAGESSTWVDGTPWDLDPYGQTITFTAQWTFNAPFNVTVTIPATKLDANGNEVPMTFPVEFKFNISANGDFVVDWGDGGARERVAHPTTTILEVPHSYTTAGTYVIGLAGRVTGYSPNSPRAAISFFNGTTDNTNVFTEGTEIYITRVSGSLGAVFPTLDANGGTSKQPQFYMTFYNAHNMSQSMDSLAGLFDGISGQPVNYMFSYTFTHCSGLTGQIPENLFPVSGTPAYMMFRSTFSNCSNIDGTIPANLFAGLSGQPAGYVFMNTFSDCSKLSGSIPEDLFAGISGQPAMYMFYRTFYGCENLTGSIPAGLFRNISGAPAQNMFGYTFGNCSKLNGSIPGNLFAGISGQPAQGMFAYTFYGCKGLTGSIPGNLFAGISGQPMTSMFSGTFTSCSGLTGQIPAGLFGNISGAPAQSMFYGTFNGCSGLTGSIPAGLFGNISGAPAQSMYGLTFHGCSKLSGEIPAGLFGNLSGVPAKAMFQQTFYQCKNLSGEIPANLFKGNAVGIFGAPQEGMFYRTFYGCENLTGSIPTGLFGNISGAPAKNMFYSVFHNCKKLSGTIPNGLFGTLSGTPATGMFEYSFYGCANLTGYVPDGLFGTIGEGLNSITGMTNVFASTGLRTDCPCGTEDVTPERFEQYWSNKVSCAVVQTPGEFYWYGDQCTTVCPITAIDELHVGALNPFPVLADKVTEKALNVKYGDTMCYVPLAAGSGGTSSFNMRYGNTVYHLDRASNTAPAGFGQ